MIRNILEEVQSPFTEKIIGELIQKYIACGCDDNLFYNSINKLDKTNKKISREGLTNKVPGKFDFMVNEKD